MKVRQIINTHNVVAITKTSLLVLVELSALSNAVDDESVTKSSTA